MSDWEWPYTVWEGSRDGAAHGRGYKFRWQAIIAAWWASLYNGQDVWIERRLPAPKAARDAS